MADVATGVTSALADVDILDAQLAALLPGEHDASPSKPGDVSISRQVARCGHENVSRKCHIRKRIVCLSSCDLVHTI